MDRSFLRFLLTCCQDDSIMHFSPASQHHWSNLFLWDGSRPHAALPPVSDDALTLKVLAGTYRTFMVTVHAGLVHHVGEYVSAHTRKTTDPIELKTLLSHSLHGPLLYEELKHVFSDEASVRMRP